MKTVKISELKANLSAHLRRVSGGEEVVVCDRNRPIARIVPIVEPELMTRRERLIAKGIASGPTKPPGEERYIPTPVVLSRPIPQDFMEKFWEEERADRA
jgi:prevent-host-death family protein